MSGEAEKIPVRRHRLPDVQCYDVTADELAQIESESMQVGTDLNFALVSLSFFIAILLTLSSAKIDSDRIFAVYIALMLVFAISSLFFYIKWNRGKKSGMTIIQRIRQREVGPLGEEGKEIRPTDLQQLPGQEPPKAGGAA